MQETKEIITVIAEHLGVTPQDIDPGASLADDLGLGPIELADLLGVLSQKFNIIFDPIEVEDLKTIHDIIVMVEDQMLEE